MINIIWMAFIIIGLLVAAVTGRIEATTQAAFDGARSAVELCFALIGIYSLWLGLMKVAEKAGLVKALSKKMTGLLKFLFPDVPAGSPAMGAMTMNIIANMLGLGNAATPLGLKAMKELNSLNHDKSTASNAMCMFIVINTSSIQLIPTTVIALRSAAGSANPAETLGTTLIATLCSSLVGIFAVTILRRFY